jgi:murein DD-endopeptidase MepM/ murein hydrolase activator NlpD
MYHINGTAIFRLAKANLSHTDRYVTDPEYFARLTSYPDLSSYARSNAAGLLKEDSKQFGDPVSHVNEELLMMHPNAVEHVGPIVPVTITSQYGWRKIKKKGKIVVVKHLGVDLRAKLNTTLYCPDDGVVLRHYHKSGVGWGNMIEIRFKDGDVMRFAHCSKLVAKIDSIIKKGAIMAFSGKSGTGAPHVHVEFLKGGKANISPTLDTKVRYKKIFSPYN